MLKPFQIRDLNDVETTGLPSPEIARAGVVQLSARQYDSVVSAHPRATLTYMDEDDGEVVAVSLVSRIQFPGASLDSTKDH
jgi:hypothetical protein